MCPKEGTDYLFFWYIIYFGGVFMIYLVIINLIAVIIMLVDKTKAMLGRWRIKESTLFAVAILGGGLGILLSMYIFNHKTRKSKFRYGIPFIALLQMLIIYVFFT